MSDSKLWKNREHIPEMFLKVKKNLWPVLSPDDCLVGRYCVGPLYLMVQRNQVPTVPINFGIGEILRLLGFVLVFCNCAVTKTGFGRYLWNPELYMAIVCVLALAVKKLPEFSELDPPPPPPT